MAVENSHLCFSRMKIIGEDLDQPAIGLAVAGRSAHRYDKLRIRLLRDTFFFPSGLTVTQNFRAMADHSAIWVRINT